MLMTSAAAAGAGVVAGMLLSSNPAGAADGDVVTVGGTFTGDQTTKLTMTSSAGPAAIAGWNVGPGAGVGLWGLSTNGNGVQGDTDANGGSGVIGNDNSGPSGGVGVQGRSPIGTGVLGITGLGIGVSAVATSQGPAPGPAGTALAVDGKVTFSTSGVATVAAHTTSVTVNLEGVSPSSLVLATAQQLTNQLVAVVAAVPGTNSFTITLSAAPRTPLQVAWFVIG
jgi:hypothetical protein